PERARALLELTLRLAPAHEENHQIGKAVSDSRVGFEEKIQSLVAVEGSQERGDALAFQIPDAPVLLVRRGGGEPVRIDSIYDDRHAIARDAPPGEILHEAAAEHGDAIH